jgi:gluconolactonase
MGAQVIAPIGVIRLPENCANICFGDTRRNRLFIAASRSLRGPEARLKTQHL